MQRFPAAGFLFAAALSLSPSIPTHAAEAVRLDTSSAASTRDSWAQMLEAVPDSEKQALMLAVLKLNLAQAQSAYDVLSSPTMQHPSIFNIRDKVNGMTAEQIIELGDQVKNLKVKAGPQS